MIDAAPPVLKVLRIPYPYSAWERFHPGLRSEKERRTPQNDHRHPVWPKENPPNSRELLRQVAPNRS